MISVTDVEGDKFPTPDGAVSDTVSYTLRDVPGRDVISVVSESDDLPVLPGARTSARGHMVPDSNVTLILLNMW